MALIHLKPVKSSSVHSFGYDPGSKTLAVKFHSGDTYHYHGVLPDVHKALAEAPSIGKHLQANVVGKYKHAKV